MHVMKLGLASLAAVVLSTASVAASVPDGTVSSVAQFNPTIDLTMDPGTYSADNGRSFEISGTGGFSAVANTTGSLNGTLSFSKTTGKLIIENLANFFVFDDGQGGTYNYSVSNVLTNAFSQTTAAASATLYTTGVIVDSNLNQLTPTAASLSIQFNSTGASAYSSALTLAVPPAMETGVPEASSWAMMIVGLGVAGGALRRQGRMRVRATYA